MSDRHSQLMKALAKTQSLTIFAKSRLTKLLIEMAIKAESDKN